MIREFYSFKNILAIDPGLDATGWAVISEKTGHLLGCGLTQPFAQVDQTQTICEIRKKLLKVWEERAGFSTNPMVLAVEMQEGGDSIPLSIMGGMIWASFIPNRCYMPRPQKWKEQWPRESVEEYFFDDFDIKSKRAYAESIHVVPRHLRHSVFEAIGLGQWAYRKWKAEQKQVAVSA